MWPEAGNAATESSIRTQGRDHPLRIAFGSCRVAAPHAAPWSLTKDEHEEGREACGDARSHPFHSTMRRMKVLVTGGAGYVGSVVAAQLLDDPSVREAYLGGAAAH